MVAKSAEEGSGTICSMSLSATMENNRLPDGISQACRFSFCAVNRSVPDKLSARRVNSADKRIRLTRALLATLQMSTKKSLGGLFVSKINSLPSTAARSSIEAGPAPVDGPGFGPVTDAVCCRLGNAYSLLTPSRWTANNLPDGSIRLSPGISGKEVTEDCSTAIENSL